MSTRPRQPRRSAAQWQSLINLQSDSGVSVRQFCTERGIGYQSFMQWRKRLSETAADSSKAPPEPAFIELTGGDDPLERSIRKHTWHIELDVAPGIQLRIGH